jgi:hypothetical protein
MGRALAIAGFCIGFVVSMATVGEAHSVETKPRTWAQFVRERDDRFLQVDYNLPDQFRNGYVYFDAKENQITAFILRRGLRNYPQRRSGRMEMSPLVGGKYVRRGQAIFFLWNLGNRAEDLAQNSQLRHPTRGTACLRITCITAPFIEKRQLERILRSERSIE